MPQGSDNRPRPNCFLIGAPKCGTTALAHYLSGHPCVFFCKPKEPFYWDADHTQTTIAHRPASLDAYLQLFSTAAPAQHVCIGEGSTTYAQSRVAAERILQFDPRAKFILMLRNPVDVVHSLHEHLVRRGFEDQADIAAAWGLQKDRAEGRGIPAGCGTPHQLQYKDVASFAPQVERLFRIVPPQQRLIIFFDDLCADARDTYLTTLEFLGLKDDGRSEFPRMNAARQARFGLLRRLYNQPPSRFARLMQLMREWYTNSRSPLRALLRRSLLKDGANRPLSPEFRQFLISEFRDDIAQTSELLGRDLTHWCRGDETTSAVLQPSASSVREVAAS